MQLAAGRTPKNSAVYAKLDADLASDKLQYSVYVGHLFARFRVLLSGTTSTLRRQLDRLELFAWLQLGRHLADSLVN